jgi:hypothetical protein
MVKVVTVASGDLAASIQRVPEDNIRLHDVKPQIVMI